MKADQNKQRITNSRLWTMESHFRLRFASNSLNCRSPAELKSPKRRSSRVNCDERTGDKLTTFELADL